MFIGPKRLEAICLFLVQGKWIQKYFLGAYGSHLSPGRWYRWLKWRLDSRGKYDRLFVPLDQPAMLEPPNWGEIDEEELVMGVVHEGEAKAYPARFLAFHHIIRDRVWNKPILITFCGRCHSGVIFDPVVKGSFLKFIPCGLRHGSMMMQDMETGTIWSHVTGEAAEGKFAGTFLEFIPSYQVTWKKWKKNHPQTLLMAPHPDFSWLYYRSDLEQDNRSFSERIKYKDESSVLLPTTPGYGLSKNGVPLFFPFEHLAKEGVMRGNIGNDPVVVFYHQESRGGGAFLPVINEQVLTFKNTRDGLFQDNETKTIWNCFGQGLQGELTGAQLQNLNVVTLQWYVWLGWHPDSIIVRESGFKGEGVPEDELIVRT